MRCTNCDHEFEPTADEQACPECGAEPMYCRVCGKVSEELNDDDECPDCCHPKVVIIIATLANDFHPEHLSDVAYVAQGDVLTDVTVFACLDDLLADLHRGVQPNAVPVPLHPEDESALPREGEHCRMTFQPEMC